MIVVGSVNVDVVLRVAQLPGAGETVRASSLSRHPGGKGGNQAVAAALLGARTLLIARVGADSDGADSRAELDRSGVDVRHVSVDRELPTGTAVVMAQAGGENTVTVASGANGALTAAEVIASMAEIDDARAVVLASLEVPIDAVVAAAEEARRRNWLFILNPAPAMNLPTQLLRLVDVLTPNQHELRAFGDGGAAALLAQGVGTVVVTRGAAGTETYEAAAGPVPVPRPAYDGVRVVDTTGAGDAFNGALAWGLAAGRPMAEAVDEASIVGALATRALGARASLPTSDELRRAIAGR